MVTRRRIPPPDPFNPKPVPTLELSATPAESTSALMEAAYPTSFDALTTDIEGSDPQAVVHADHHNAVAGAVNSLEITLGALPQGSDATVKARLDRIETKSALGLQEAFLASQANAGASTITIDHTSPPLLTGRSTVLIIDPGSTSTEIRAASSIAGAVVTLNRVLVNTHAANARVIVWPGTFIPTYMFGAKGDGSSDTGTDDTVALQAGINECKQANLWLDGGGTTSMISKPLVFPQSAMVRRLRMNALPGFSPIDANNAMGITSQDGPNAFTATAASDTFTTLSDNGIGAVNNQVVFTGSNLPSPIVAGRIYFVKTLPDNTHITISATSGGATIDLTTDGSGVMYGDALTIGKIYLEDIYFDGRVRTAINGFSANLQQQTEIYKLRVDNCLGTGFIVTGQQWCVYNLEIISCGVGLDISGSEGYFFGANIEQCVTNAISLAGQAHLFSGFHFETTPIYVWVKSTADLRSAHFDTPYFSIYGGTTSLIRVETALCSMMVTNPRFPGGSGSSVVVTDTIIPVTYTKANFTYDLDGYEPFFARPYAGSPSSGWMLSSAMFFGAASPAFVFKSGNFTADFSNTIYYVNTSGGNVTATLPTAVGNMGKRIRIKRIGSASNVLTIATVSSQTIESGGPTSITPAVNEYVEIYSDGVGWYRTSDARRMTATATLDWASIPANTTAVKTVTMTGARVGDVAHASPNTTIETGLIWSAYVSAANTVTITLGNVTVAAIDPASVSWRVFVDGA